MRLSRFRPAALAALMLALVLALAPALAEARAGGGTSSGSRGSRTYSAPSATPTAPYSAAPMQRSLTQPEAPRYAAPAYAPGFGGRSPFMSGLLGGLIGAGIGGLLFGHGLFGGIHGIFGFLGFLLQIYLLYLVGRWLFRRFGQGFAFAAPGGAARGPGMGMAGGGVAGGIGGRPAAAPVAITPQDYQQFERALIDIQAAWSAHDLSALQRLATPEMVSYFAEQLAEQESRGVRNLVRDVRLERGDLSEAWAEQGREYATVAMQFSMTDVTLDRAGRVADGSATERVMVTELWTFLRAQGGSWLLSAIQQAR